MTAAPEISQHLVKVTCLLGHGCITTMQSQKAVSAYFIQVSRYCLLALHGCTQPGWDTWPQNKHKPAAQWCCKLANCDPTSCLCLTVESRLIHWLPLYSVQAGNEHGEPHKRQARPAGNWSG